MEIEVYDTYARSEEGLKIHFDVMLPIGGDEATAQDKAREFIEKISETANPVQLESCRFCHTETAKPEVGERVEQEGYCIVPIENVRISRIDFPQHSSADQKDGKKILETRKT